jgi:hypothetical protein
MIMSEHTLTIAAWLASSQFCLQNYFFPADCNCTLFICTDVLLLVENPSTEVSTWKHFWHGMHAA